MNIAIFVRSDAPAKSGGDLVQARQYIAALERRGIKAELVGSAHELGAATVLHVFNLDRPWDALPLLEAASKRGIPVVLSTLLHPRDDVLRYQRERSFRGERILLGSGVSPDFTERVKAILRGLMARKVLVVFSAMRHSLRSAQKRLWEQSAGIQLLSEAEAEALAARGFAFGEKQTSVVRNGVFPPAVASVSGLRPDLVAFIAQHEKFCVFGGRIEPRKNQCALLEIAALSHIPVIFAGAMNHRHSNYARRFHELVKRRDNVFYAGEVSRPDFDALLRACHQHISVSLFEVSSLVDLEARAAGAWIVSSKSGYAQEFLDDGAYICDPWSSGSIQESVSSAWAQPRRALPMAVPSWDQAGERLIELYNRVVTPT